MCNANYKCVMQITTSCQCWWRRWWRRWWCIANIQHAVECWQVWTCNVQAEVNRSYTKHRKIASSFRDTQLFEIFELGINLLKKAYEMIKTVDYSDADQVSNVCMSSLFLLPHGLNITSNFSQCGGATIIVFQYHTLWQYSNGDP